MTRQSNNGYNDQGDLVNGYDYSLRCWVKDGIIQDCGHPKDMICGCISRAYAGREWSTMENRDKEPKQ